MSRIFLLIVILGVSFQKNARAGINMKKPLGVFHLDGQSHTSKSDLVNVEDDIIVDRNGNVRIGQLPHLDTKSIYTMVVCKC